MFQASYRSAASDQDSLLAQKEVELKKAWEAVEDAAKQRDSDKQAYEDEIEKMEDEIASLRSPNIASKRSHSLSLTFSLSTSRCSRERDGEELDKRAAECKKLAEDLALGSSLP